jgi:hypothetical protein
MSNFKVKGDDFHSLILTNSDSNVVKESFPNIQATRNTTSNLTHLTPAMSGYLIKGVDVSKYCEAYSFKSSTNTKYHAIPSWAKHYTSICLSGGGGGGGGGGTSHGDGKNSNSWGWGGKGGAGGGGQRAYQSGAVPHAYNWVCLIRGLGGQGGNGGAGARHGVDGNNSNARNAGNGKIGATGEGSYVIFQKGENANQSYNREILVHTQGGNGGAGGAGGWSQVKSKSNRAGNNGGSGFNGNTGDRHNGDPYSTSLLGNSNSNWGVSNSNGNGGAGSMGGAIIGNSIPAGNVNGEIGNNSSNQMTNTQAAAASGAAANLNGKKGSTGGTGHASIFFRNDDS